jgi:protein gp37
MMAENSKIEWCDHTFNPWIGCQKVSPGCDHCYAEAMMDKRYGRVQWGPHGERKRTSEDNWKKPLAWAKRANGHRPRVFCASLADWLDNRVPLQWRSDLGRLIEATPELDWLLLTKRPENSISCGDFKAVRKIIALTGIKGEWMKTKHNYQFRAPGGAILNYWKSTGTITFQGPELAEAELKAMFLRRAVVIK